MGMEAKVTVVVNVKSQLVYQPPRMPRLEGEEGKWGGCISLGHAPSCQELLCPARRVQCPARSMQCPARSMQCPARSVQCPPAAPLPCHMQQHCPWQTSYELRAACKMAQSNSVSLLVEEIPRHCPREISSKQAGLADPDDRQTVATAAAKSSQ